MNDTTAKPAQSPITSYDIALATPVCHRVLVAHDLSPGALAIFERALQIALRSKARLFLAHVDDPLRVNTLGFMPPESYEQWVHGCQEQVRRQLEPLAAQAQKAGVETQILALVGSRGDELLDAARLHHIDLIITGFHHHHWLARLIGGSTAIDIVKEAPCPILILPNSPNQPPAPASNRPPAAP
jgi:nucleotide-binding universal stress UspA family protein